MKISFTNKKERKNCQKFIKAMRELLNFVEIETQNHIYLTAGSRQLKMASSIYDFHRVNVSQNYLVVMKSDSYSYQNLYQDNEERIYKINCLKFLKAFKKNEAKVSFLQLLCEEQKTTLTFDMENNLIVFKIFAQSECIFQKWPQQPDSEQSSYQIIKVAQISGEKLKSLTLSTEEEQIWIEITQDGLQLRTVQNGKYRKENKLTLGEADNFFCTTLRAKLKKKMFIQLRGQFLMQLVNDSLKKKSSISVNLKNIYDRYNQNQISMSYLITKIDTDFGHILGIIRCYICEQMGKEGEQFIRKEINKQRQKESSLLKRQQTFEDIRRMALNRFNQPGFDRKMAEQAYRDRKPYGKIEQGGQVIERIHRQIE